VVALKHSKDVIHTYNAPISSVNDVTCYPTNLAIPIIVKQKIPSFTLFRTLDVNSNGCVIERIVSLKNEMKCFTKTKGKGGERKVFGFHLKDIEGYEVKFISYKDDNERLFFPNDSNQNNI